MKSNVIQKCRQFKQSASTATLIALTLSIATLSSTAAQAQSNYKLIEQEIEQAEGALKTTEKFIEQLLWREVPDNQAQAKEANEKTSAAVTELSELAKRIDTTQENLLRARNQLVRSNQILAVSQQELIQSQREIENLEKQKQVSLTTLSTLTNNIQQLQQQTLSVSALIENPGPELERLRGLLATAKQENALRSQQAVQLQQTEAQFQEDLSIKQSRLNSIKVLFGTNLVYKISTKT